MNVRPDIYQHNASTPMHLWVVFAGAIPVAFCPTAFKAEQVADALALHATLDGRTPDVHIVGPACIHLIGTLWLIVHGTDAIAFCSTDGKADQVADALALYADLGHCGEVAA